MWKQFLGTTGVVYGYSHVGHDMIFEAADKIMLGKPHKLIEADMKGKFHDADNWAHDFSLANEQLANVHDQPLGDWVCSVPKPKADQSGSNPPRPSVVSYSDCPQGMEICTLPAAQMIYARLLGEEVRVEPAELRNLALDQHLKLLVTLIADIHNPLTFAFMSLHQGTDVFVTLPGGRRASLFDIFDSDLPSSVKLADLTELRQDYKHEWATYKDMEPKEMLALWADEAAKASCYDVLQQLVPTSASRDIPRDVTLSPETHKKWKDLVSKMMGKAAVRLAVVMTRYVDHAHPSHHIDHFKHHHRGQWYHNAVKNMCIAAIVVPLILFGLHKAGKPRETLKVKMRD